MKTGAIVGLARCRGGRARPRGGGSARPRVVPSELVSYRSERLRESVIRSVSGRRRENRRVATPRGDGTGVRVISETGSRGKRAGLICPQNGEGRGVCRFRQFNYFPPMAALFPCQPPRLMVLCLIGASLVRLAFPQPRSFLAVVLCLLDSQWRVGNLNDPREQLSALPFVRPSFTNFD